MFTEFKEIVVNNRNRHIEILTHIRDNMVSDTPYFYLCDCLSYLIYESNIPKSLDIETSDFTITRDEHLEVTKIFDYYNSKFDADRWWNNSYGDLENAIEIRDRIEDKKLWLTSVINDIKEKYV